MDDQRRAARYAVSWPLRIGAKTSGRTFNVSFSGILFLSQSRLDVRSITELEIALGPGRRIGCTVRILREAPTSGGYYAYGAEFLGFPGSDRGVLMNVLQRLRIQGDDAAAPAAGQKAPAA